MIFKPFVILCGYGTHYMNEKEGITGIIRNPEMVKKLRELLEFV